ncbi:hypothetical protein [Methanobacterium sp.]|uniref:DISARM anti-phage system protein DrmE domain-containing protein n=1 Tax=Methanobacterium sp. TaxID=2164 RepID=UPI0025E8E436|nr:hypothetical protein [Methanobacterium sp.]MBI5458972.1 hypothetical protein [Methanobacterium sp.]
MIKWHEKIHEILAYDPYCDEMDYYDNNKLSNKLSPITNIFLNTFINTLEDKNLIIFIPDFMLRPIPLLSYFYSYLNKKSALIFSQKGQRVNESPIDLHMRNYYMLNWQGEYLFYDIPIGLMTNKDVKAEFFFPRIHNRHLKQRYISRQEDNFVDNNKSKILLYHDNKGNKIFKSIKNLIIDKKKIQSDLKLDLGLIIFENLDRFIYSDYTYRIFLKWLKELLPKSTRFIFHFSNPRQMKYINQLKDATNSLVLPFTTNLLQNNEEIKIKSLKYFNLEECRPIINLLNRYNVDLPRFYQDNKEIEIFDPLESGNIDDHFEGAQNITRVIDDKKLINKRAYYTAWKMLNIMSDLSINPSRYKSISKNNDSWRYYSIPEIIENLEFNLEKEHENNQLPLKRFISEVNSVYEELSQCKRFSEKKSFSRIAKDYELINIAKNIDDPENTIIATYSALEKRILREDLDKIGLKAVNVEDINWISYKHFDRSDKKLILPGALKTKNMLELFLPYKEIKFLAYEGLNEKRIKNQVDLASTYSYEEEKFSMNYVSEIYSFIDIEKDGAFFEDFYKRKKIYEKDEEIEQPPIQDSNPFEEFKNKIFKKAYSSEYQSEIEFVEKQIDEIESTDAETGSFDEYAEFLLLSLKNERKYRKKLNMGKTYFYLKSLGGNVFEGTPKMFKPGNFIVILDDDDQKSLLQLIIDIFDLEESVNNKLIEYWKYAFMKFIKHQKISENELYNRYLDLGGQRTKAAVRNWAKGSVLGPDDPNDLLIIGKIIDNQAIIDNYNMMNSEIDKIRNIHRITGRRLKTIIKKIIFERDDLEPSKLNYEEYLFYEKVKNGIYKILE